MSIGYQEEYDMGAAPMPPERPTELNDWVGSSDSEVLHPARAAYRARLSWWLLRILLGAGGMPRYCETGSVRMGLIADLLDIPELADPATRVQQVQLALGDAFKIAQLALRDEQRLDEQRISPAVEDCTMSRNIQWLAQSAGLNAIEQEIAQPGEP